MTSENGHDKNTQVLARLDIYLSQLKDVIQGLDDVVEQAQHVEELPKSSDEILIPKTVKKGSKDGQKRPRNKPAN